MRALGARGLSSTLSTPTITAIHAAAVHDIRSGVAKSGRHLPLKQTRAGSIPASRAIGPMPKWTRYAIFNRDGQSSSLCGPTNAHGKLTSGIAWFLKPVMRSSNLRPCTTTTYPSSEGGCLQSSYSLVQLQPSSPCFCQRTQMVRDAFRKRALVRFDSGLWLQTAESWANSKPVVLKTTESATSRCPGASPRTLLHDSVV